MKREVLLAYESQKYVSKVISVPQSQIVKKVQDITIKTPLVLKMISSQAVHKTEVGGIKIVYHKSELEDAFREILDSAKKHKISLEGVMAQEFIEGQQLILGLKRDAVFGHMVLVGLGGIFTEIIGDTAIRKCPVTISEAQDMLNELKASKLFSGYRNIKLNTQALKDAIVEVSKLPSKFKNISELDINPFILNSKGGYAVDVRIVLDK